MITIPENNTVVGYRSGTNNVTFKCSFTPNDGQQSVTQWNIANFMGTKGAADLKTVIPSVSLFGTPSTGGFFPSFREYALFPEYSYDLHGTTLFCGYSSNILAALFHLEVYRELK